jgi:FtsP/CotA-like multicopper oxidase with cupredoxin domain
MRFDSTQGRPAHRATAALVRTSVATVAAAGLLAGGIALAVPAAAAGAASHGSASLPVTVTPGAATPAAASAVGRLAPSGCSGTGTVTCDIYSRAGTTAMPGALTTIPIWGFASDAGSPATAPGPVLVVRQGDQVTINLHNGLTQPMSLALPGQRGVNGGAGDDLTGVGPNGVQSYAFTASRPGTFVYEAGHTADGARQVAMGLAGALVVLPSVATRPVTPTRRTPMTPYWS